MVDSLILPLLFNAVPNYSIASSCTNTIGQKDISNEIRLLLLNSIAFLFYLTSRFISIILSLKIGLSVR